MVAVVGGLDPAGSRKSGRAWSVDKLAYAFLFPILSVKVVVVYWYWQQWRSTVSWKFLLKLKWWTLCLADWSLLGTLMAQEHDLILVVVLQSSTC
jgi:hypothetical protein